MKRLYLGEFEEIVLLMVAVHYEDAYGLAMIPKISFEGLWKRIPHVWHNVSSVGIAETLSTNLFWVTWRSSSIKTNQNMATVKPNGAIGWEYFSSLTASHWNERLILIIITIILLPWLKITSSVLYVFSEKTKDLPSSISLAWPLVSAAFCWLWYSCSTSFPLMTFMPIKSVFFE